MLEIGRRFSSLDQVAEDQRESARVGPRVDPSLRRSQIYRRPQTPFTPTTPHQLTCEAYSNKRPNVSVFCPTIPCTPRALFRSGTVKRLNGSPRAITKTFASEVCFRIIFAAAAGSGVPFSFRND